MNHLSSPLAPTAPASSVRWDPTHALILLIAFLALGTLLFLKGTPTGAILALLGGCGAVGAGTLALAGGGRHWLIAVLAEVAMRSGTGR
ncbi:hypothetical protein KV381_36240 [Streptomyces sp. WY228]|nr:hypothetical protein KV381_00260 [Streptomyces sp. WY228]QXR01247.1 hypothetical protein KV381_36240 [Streptomyces sp. WY228]